ncbi:hypothetical protein O3M35_010797 [Rhynocoris fuscipes]|uniref:Uncharacterized protein n=1 Tax=Rhynocoris fuscipes TaxID=488301 RepID=A0AAW1D341_9HEMI
MQFKYLIILAVVVFSALLSQVESTEVGGIKAVEAMNLQEAGGAREPRKSKKGGMFKKVLKKVGKKILKKKFGK